MSKELTTEQEAYAGNTVWTIDLCRTTENP